MKAFYLLLLAAGLSSPSAGAQTLRGGYATQVVFGGTFYWFKAGRFQEVSYSCLGNCFGNGTYVVRGNRLLLHYATWAKRPTAKSDSIQVKVQVLNAKTHLPIEVSPVAPPPPADTVKFRLPLDSLALAAIMAKAEAKEAQYEYIYSASGGFDNNCRTASNCRDSYLLRGPTGFSRYRTDKKRDWFQRVTLAESKAALAEYEKLRAAFYSPH